MNEFERLINELDESIGSNPVDKSEEQAWEEFLDESLPAPAILGKENKVINNKLIEGKKILCIIDKDFTIIEKVEDIWDNGDFSSKAMEMLTRNGYGPTDIDILDESIEETKLALHNEFSIDNIENEFTKESSNEYLDFKEQMLIMGKETIDKFLDR